VNSPNPIRFIKLGDDNAELPAAAATWSQVRDNETGLIWMADALAERMEWIVAKQAATEPRIGGNDDWRLPTIKELLSIVDYDRFETAINTDFFRMPEVWLWFWSGTPAASSPSGDAWLVDFLNGHSFYYHQNNDGLVRPVRSARARQ
jgi:hypothetical protein